MEAIILIFKNYWLEIIGFSLGAYFYIHKKNKKWQDFCVQQHLHTEKKVYKKVDNVKKEIIEVKYPSYTNSKREIVIKNLGYNVDFESIKNHLNNYERFFKSDITDVILDKKKNLVFKKSIFPKIVKPYIKKSVLALLGKTENNQEIVLDFLKGVRAFFGGASHLGKSTLIDLILRQTNLDSEIYILAPRKSFKHNNQKYFDSQSIEDIRNFLSELKEIKEQISKIKTQLRNDGFKDEYFYKYVLEKKINYKYKIFILDDASTYLKTNLYSKTDEFKKEIETLINEVNKILREWRIYGCSIFIVAHSSSADEIDISQANYSHILLNKVSNESLSKSATGDSKALMNPILGIGMWYLKSEKFTGYIKTVYES